MTNLPRWRGFNLVDLFSTSRRWLEYFPMYEGFLEQDFEWLRSWGFDFVRLPISYLYLVGDSARHLSDERLKLLDAAVQFAQEYGVHASINLHRAPGYCVNEYPFDFPETVDLFQSSDAADLLVNYWTELAERYKGIPSDMLSFDVMNEPPSVVSGRVSMKQVLSVSEAVVAAVRDVDPERLIFVEPPEGGAGFVPLEWLKKLNVAGSPHCYEPHEVSHFRCPWAEERGSMIWPSAEWPLRNAARPEARMPGVGAVRNRDELEKHLSPWLEAQSQGLGVHLGETGAYKQTPHRVALAWLSDLLDILTSHGIGYALWNFRGPLGVLDSGRADVAYEPWHGHLLDRSLLELLQSH